MATTRIIISGTVDMAPEKVAPALAEAQPLIEGALREKGCLDYDWCPDPRIPGRIRVFERWETQEDLHQHLNDECYFYMGACLGKYCIPAVDNYHPRLKILEPVYEDLGLHRAGFF